MLRRFILAAMTLVLAPPVSAMPSSAPPVPVTPVPVPTISPPVSPPTASITWPEVGGKKVGGVAKVKCDVTTEGKLTNCAIIFECPVGYGFGEATLKAARYFKMKAPAAGGSVIIPLVWKLGDDAPPPAKCLSQSRTRSPTLSQSPFGDRF